MKRTTIRLDAPLLAEAKKFGAETGRTLTAVIEDALREVLARRKTPRKQRTAHLPTFAGNGLQPGVDLNDSAALLDYMERYDAADRR